MENSIEIRDLTCRYPSFALEGINLEVPCGTVLGLIGENGAGKSIRHGCWSWTSPPADLIP